MARFTRLLLTSLSLAFIAGCNTLSNMNTVNLRNTSHFPDYELSAGLIDTCGSKLIRSNKRTVMKLSLFGTRRVTRSS